MKDSAVLAFLEAIYALDLDDQSWLARMLAATKALAGPEHTYLGYFYDASNANSFEVWNVCALDTPPEVHAAFRAARVTVGPELLAATLRGVHVASIRQSGMPHVAALLDERERVGWGDILSVNGLDPSGIGCLLTIGTRAREFSPPPREAAIYARIAHHVATAFRCRRRLGITRPPRGPRQGAPSAAAEAIIDASGRVIHAEGEAAGKRARERIRAAALSVAALRAGREGKVRDALEVWRPLVNARWTLVDSFQENGERYIVAQENQSPPIAADPLTHRERQVVQQAALGFTNKEVAYALGISSATVRVLMARAAAKIGVRTRVELLSHPRIREMRRPKPS